MKVKDLIKKLQECDPESIITTSEGALLDFIQELPGYYDGAYDYRDGKKYVRSRDGFKTVLYIQDIEDFILDAAYERKTKDEINNLLCFDRTQYNYDSMIEEAVSGAKEFHDKSDKKFMNDVTKKYNEGFKAAQSATSAIGHYNVMWWYKDGDIRTNKYGADGVSLDDGLRQGDCGIIIRNKDKVFKPVETENINGEKIIVWELINVF